MTVKKQFFACKIYFGFNETWIATFFCPIIMEKGEIFPLVVGTDCYYGKFVFLSFIFRFRNRFPYPRVGKFTKAPKPERTDKAVRFSSFRRWIFRKNIVIRWIIHRKKHAGIFFFYENIYESHMNLKKIKIKKISVPCKSALFQKIT